MPFHMRDLARSLRGEEHQAVLIGNVPLAEYLPELPDLVWAKPAVARVFLMTPAQARALG